MKVLDLTHTITPDMPVYPGTEPPTFAPANTYEKDGFRDADGAPIRAMAWWDETE